MENVGMGEALWFIKEREWSGCHRVDHQNPGGGWRVTDCGLVERKGSDTDESTVLFGPPVVRSSSSPETNLWDNGPT
jgi:hypothetical protein